MIGMAVFNSALSHTANAAACSCCWVVARLGILVLVLVIFFTVLTADIGWPTGNGIKLCNSQACFLAQLCLAPA